MYVISVNENLIETLRLRVESEPLFAERNCLGDFNESNSLPNTVKATALIASELDKCEPTVHKWLVLVAKDWETNILDAIVNISRILMAQNCEEANNSLWQNNKSSILVIKKDHAVDDRDILQHHIDAAQDGWREEWKADYEKRKNFGESRARTEHLAKLERWITPTPFGYELIYMDQPDLLRIRDFTGFPSGYELTIADAPAENSNNCFSKPPALHWTNYPRDAEVQVLFKFTFPVGTITDPTFRRWTALVKESHNWKYEYEWTNGIFLREQLVKIALVRALENVIEVTGRIDKDEASEEEDSEDNDESKPLDRVWPYFAKVFTSFINAVDSIKTLPYTLNLVFIGDLFFSCPLGARQVTSRSFDAIQTLGAIQRAKVVRFQVQNEPDQIYSLCLEQAFPGFRPIQVCDFRSEVVGKLPTETSQTENLSSSDITFDLSTTPNADDYSFSNESLATANTLSSANKKILTPTSSSSALLSEKNRGSSNCLLAERAINATKNRGRRVSFGAIHSIPPLETVPTTSTTMAPSPLIGKHNQRLLENCVGASDERKCTNDDKNCNSYNFANQTKNASNEDEDDEDDSIVQTNNVVNEYIDKMLQNAMDEVLINN